MRVAKNIKKFNQGTIKMEQKNENKKDLRNEFKIFERRISMKIKDIENVKFYNDEGKELFGIKEIEAFEEMDRFGNRIKHRKIYQYVINVGEGVRVELEGYLFDKKENEMIIIPHGNVKIVKDKKNDSF